MSKLDLSGAVGVSGHLFLGTDPALPCEGRAAAVPVAGDLALLDANGDGRIDISDAVSVLGYLFLGNTPPPVLGSQCTRIAGCADVFTP